MHEVEGPHPPGYLMESARETVRLEAKTSANDTRAQLALVGLPPDARALDAGAGSGAVARTMARELAGGGGRVVALDRSAARLEDGAELAARAGLRNLRFACGDLHAAPFRRASFDFVWCRFVLEYLPDPFAAIDALAALVRPGGKLVVGDLDGNAMQHYPMPPLVERGLATLMGALEGRFDPWVGRKLFHGLRRAGLRDVRVHVLPYHLYAGAAPAAALDNWTEKVRTLRPHGERAFGSAAAFDAFADAFVGMLRDPDVLTYSVLLLVEGTQPP